MSHADVQAWGNLLNLAVLLFFMAVLGQYGPTYNPTRLSIVWRLQYGLGLLPICYMVYHRTFKLKESEVWKVRLMAWTDIVLWLQEIEAAADAAPCDGKGAGAAGISVAYYPTVLGQLASVLRTVTLYCIPGTLLCFAMHYLFCKHTQAVRRVPRCPGISNLD